MLLSRRIKVENHLEPFVSPSVSGGIQLACLTQLAFYKMKISKKLLRERSMNYSVNIKVFQWLCLWISFLIDKQAFFFWGLGGGGVLGGIPKTAYLKAVSDKLPCYQRFISVLRISFGYSWWDQCFLMLDSYLNGGGGGEPKLKFQNSLNQRLLKEKAYSFSRPNRGKLIE